METTGSFISTFATIHQRQFTHDGAIPISSEKMPPKPERLIVLCWLEPIHPKLPDHVGKVFSAELCSKNKTTTHHIRTSRRSSKSNRTTTRRKMARADVKSLTLAKLQKHQSERPKYRQNILQTLSLNVTDDEYIYLLTLVQLQM